MLDEIAERAAATVEQRLAGAEPWLTTEAAAAHLGIAVSTLYTLVSQRHRNRLPVVKEGARSYFRASALDAWRLSSSGTNAPDSLDESSATA